MRVARFAILVLLTIIFLTACATQPTPTGPELPGFWLGLVHGFISPFALIAHLFTDARIYAFPNSGGWYDLGFVMGAAAIFGGGGTRVNVAR